MDFWPTDEQNELAEGVRAFLNDRYPSEHLQAVEETDAVIDLIRWRELAEMGVFAMRSQGFGAREATLIYEELGRALVPGPLVATQIADGLVDGSASGERRVGLLESNGDIIMVEHPDQVDHLIWFDRQTLRLIETAALSIEPVKRPLDALSPAGVVTTDPAALRDGASVLLEGPGVDQLRHLGAVLTAALQVGIAAAVTESSNAYAKEREQFGRPIGGFQAVKHMLAEMYVAADLARTAVQAAGCVLDGVGDVSPERASSAAKVVAGNAAEFCGRTGIQIFGGMGFTWEVDAQRYWKRAIILNRTFGSSSDHALAMSELLLEGRV